jgi:hypothetical protein
MRPNPIHASVTRSSYLVPSHQAVLASTAPRAVERIPRRTSLPKRAMVCFDIGGSHNQPTSAVSWTGVKHARDTTRAHERLR